MQMIMIANYKECKSFFDIVKTNRIKIHNQEIITYISIY